MDKTADNSAQICAIIKAHFHILIMILALSVKIESKINDAIVISMIGGKCDAAPGK